MGYGPLVLGHSPKSVTNAVKRQLSLGIGITAARRQEVQLSETICRIVPSAEVCVFSSTGTEAVQAAIRIARASTGRNRVIKFQGHYHGWMDSLNIGGYDQSDPSPGTAGQDPKSSEAVTVCKWNDLQALVTALSDDVAAVIMEPINIDGGGIPADPEYILAAAMEIRKAGALLVFDEVITGFRVALGGAQEVLNVIPDLTILGKALGGGLPISAVCGRKEVMGVVSSGQVSHMGTFNANPISTAAAVAVLTELEANEAVYYPKLHLGTKTLAEILIHEAQKVDFPFQIITHTGVAHGFVGENLVVSHADTLKTSKDKYKEFCANMLEEGVHLMSKGILYTSTAHTSEDFEITKRAANKAFSKLSRIRH